MKSKHKAILEILYAEGSNIIIGRMNFGAKTQEIDCYKLFEITKKKSYFYRCLQICITDAYPYAENQDLSLLQSWHIADTTMAFTLGSPRCASPAHMNGLKNKYIIIYDTCKRSNSYWSLFLRCF